MSYQDALEAAGAEVLLWHEFGSYQGDWWSKVKIDDKQAWVSGSYGSCSGCDSFQAEFGYQDGQCEDHVYGSDSHPECEACQLRAKDYHDRLESFGNDYLQNSMTQEQAEAEASKNIEWDVEAESMLQWLKDNKIE